MYCAVTKGTRFMVRSNLRNVGLKGRSFHSNKFNTSRNINFTSKNLPFNVKRFSTPAKPSLSSSIPRIGLLFFVSNKFNNFNCFASSNYPIPSKSSHFLLRSLSDDRDIHKIRQRNQPKTSNDIIKIDILLHLEDQMSSFFPNKSWFFLGILKIWRSVQLFGLFFPLVVTAPLAYFNDSFFHLWLSWIHKTFEIAGPCWIKFGQWISTRRDLVSEEIVKQLSSFYAQCPVHSLEYTKDLFRKEFDSELEDVFLSFDEVPIASGAIAQVYKATLKDGRTVAVKVQHPSAALTMLIDLELANRFARVLERFVPQIRFMDLASAIESFSANMVAQLDFRLEARNLQKFRDNFRSEKDILFPEPISGLASKGILCETFEEGEGINSILEEADILRQKGLPPSEYHRRIASLGMKSYLKMMLQDHLIHADLHPGNILVRQDGKDGRFKLILLDVGLVTELSKRDSHNFMALFKSVMKRNGAEAARLMIEQSTEVDFHNKENEKNFIREMDLLFQRVWESSSMRDIEVGKFLGDIMHNMRKYHVRFEGNFGTLMLATIVLEGVGKRLDPFLNLVREALPFILKTIRVDVDPLVAH